MSIFKTTKIVLILFMIIVVQCQKKSKTSIDLSEKYVVKKERLN